MTPLSILATVVGVFMALATLPQILKIYKRKSAKDISAITYAIIGTGAFVWVLYGLEIKNFAIILSNSIGTVTSTVVLIEYYFYGRNNK